MELPACADWALPPEGTSYAEWNPGVCAFCGRPTMGEEVLDHDHDTGFERGYTCRRCNRMEPLAWHEAHELYPAWSAWRAGCNPAALLGQAVPYEGWGWRDGVNTLEAYYAAMPTDEAAVLEALNNMFKKPTD